VAHGHHGDAHHGRVEGEKKPMGEKIKEMIPGGWSCCLPLLFCLLLLARCAAPAVQQCSGLPGALSLQCSSADDRPLLHLCGGMRRTAECIACSSAERWPPWSCHSGSLCVLRMCIGSCCTASR
jgi:hypothetical protein